MTVFSGQESMHPPLAQEHAEHEAELLSLLLGADVQSGGLDWSADQERTQDLTKARL